MSGSDDDQVSEIREQYRRSIMAWESAREVSVRQANAMARASRLYELRIRESTAGRQAIEGLLTDPSTGVRAAAAFQTLKWNPELALGVLKEIVRRDKGMPGFEAAMVLKEYEAGRLDLDWEPKPKTPRGPRSKPQPSFLRPSSAQLDAVVSVHSTTMSGGFPNSLAVSGTLFADAIVGYERIGLLAAADLVRSAFTLLRVAQLPADHDRRASLIDCLPADQAKSLDDLSDQYQDLFPSDEILFDAIESVSTPERS